MSEPEHLILKRKLSQMKEPSYEQLCRYIEVSKKGGHFSLYAMGKCPTNEMFIRLYQNNNIFHQYCDDFAIYIFQFINQHNLIRAANEFVTPHNIDFADIPKCIKYALTKNYFIHPLLQKKYNSLMLKECKNTPLLYINYIQIINMNEKQEKQFINKVLKNSWQIADKLPTYIKYKSNQDYLMSQVMLKKITQ